MRKVPTFSAAVSLVMKYGSITNSQRPNIRVWNENATSLTKRKLKSLPTAEVMLILF
jgi:hypothetical protein